MLFRDQLIGRVTESASSLKPVCVYVCSVCVLRCSIVIAPRRASSPIAPELERVSLRSVHSEEEEDCVFTIPLPLARSLSLRSLSISLSVSPVPYLSLSLPSPSALFSFDLVFLFPA